jgi:hypothetical protein
MHIISLQSSSNTSSWYFLVCSTAIFPAFDLIRLFARMYKSCLYIKGTGGYTRVHYDAHDVFMAHLRHTMFVNHQMIDTKTSILANSASLIMWVLCARRKERCD